MSGVFRAKISKKYQAFPKNVKWSWTIFRQFVRIFMSKKDIYIYICFPKWGRFVVLLDFFPQIFEKGRSDLGSSG